MATPYTIKREKAIRLLTECVKYFRTYQKKYYPPGFGNSEFITRKISYQIYPIKSVLELLCLERAVRQELPNLTKPCFVLQSTSDHIVTADSLEKIFSNVSSRVKRKKYIQKAYHTFISDIRNENVFEEILKFLNEN